MNPWHDVDPGKEVPEVVQCVIEIPRGGHLKYELDKESGLLRLDRVLYSAVLYPANYGFVPRSYWEDGDPLDILVLGREPAMPLCIMTARLIGVMKMIDQEEEDDKIIAVHVNDPTVSHFQDIEDLPPHTLHELKRFFEDYKTLEHKDVRIEEFLGRADGQEALMKGLQLYQKYFCKGIDAEAEAALHQSQKYFAELNTDERGKELL
jgi:inorganic pyrophosphatase